jgi:AcrR family transcriptional regulator
MSRQRTRPTRDNTRQRLFAAAACLFEARGIGASSIDAIAAEAGFTRGAFYSNFATKDELIVAMLEDHAERSRAHYRTLLAEHPDPADFIAVMRSAERSREDPLGRAPLLQLELILFVARAGKRRRELALHLRAGRASIAELVAAIYRGRDIDPAWAGAMLLALQDGFRLHRLIDPDATPAAAFENAVIELRRLVG